MAGEEEAPEPVEIEVEISAAEAQQCQLASPSSSDEGYARSRSQRLGADTPHASSCSAALNRAGSASTAWAALVLALIVARRRSIT